MNNHFRCTLFAILYLIPTIFIAFQFLRNTIQISDLFYQTIKSNNFTAVYVLLAAPFAYILCLCFATKISLLFSSLFFTGAIVYYIVLNFYFTASAYCFVPFFVIYAWYFVYRMKKELTKSKKLIECGCVFVFGNAVALLFCYYLSLFFVFLYSLAMFKLVLLIFNSYSSNFYYFTFMFVIYSLHFYATYNFFIAFSCYFVVLYATLNMIRKINKQKYYVIYNAIKQTITNIYEILRAGCMSNKKDLVINMNNSTRDNIFSKDFLYYILGLTYANHRKISHMKIPFMTYFNCCCEAKIENERFEHFEIPNYCYKLCYLVNFRNAIVNISLIIFLMYNDTKIDLYIFTIVFWLIYFANTLLCYVIDHACNMLILFICYNGEKQMQRYNKKISDKLLDIVK